MMNLTDVCAALVALARTGKSYYVTRWIATYIIPETELNIFTNVPINLNKLAEYCYLRYKIPEDEIFRRIHIIPRETEFRWKNRELVMWDELTEAQQEAFTSHNKRDRKGKDKYIFDGPWLYFFDVDIEKSIIILDEAHNFCGDTSPTAIQESWIKWLSEMGHRKAVFRAITQAYPQLGSGITQPCTSVYRLKNLSLRKIPYANIEVYDLQMMGEAFFFIPFIQWMFCQKEVKDEFNPKAKPHWEGVEKYAMTSRIFELYDSHNKPIEGAQGKDKESTPFETTWQEFRRKYGAIGGRAKLLSWFFTKHGSKLLVLSALILVGYHVATNFMDIMKSFSETVSSSFVGELNKKDTGKDNITVTTKEDREKEPDKLPKIVGLTSNCIITDSGKFIKIGGSYNGSIIEAIDFKNRTVVLRNGTIIYCDF